MESHSDPLDYPLPIVGVEALGRILIRLEAEGGWDEIIKRSDQDLIENNQNVREFLHRMWYRSPEEERILRTQAHLITHELLRTQAGLDIFFL